MGCCAIEVEGAAAISMQAHTASSGHPAISANNALADLYRMICTDSTQVSVDEPDRNGSYFDKKMSPGIGCGTLDLVSFDDDFFVMNMRGRFNQDLSYKIIGEGWTRLHFSRKSARASMDFEGIGQTDLKGPLCQILHQPEGVEDEEWIEGGVDLEWVTMFMRPRLLVERFKLDSVGLMDPVRRLAYGSDDFLLRNWSLSPAMIGAISQLLAETYTGDLRRVHLEAKATELICMMSGVMRDRPDETLPVKLTKADIDRLHEARALLANSYDQPPGIDALSRQLGLNRNKLSYGFKHFFDMTISEFCAECRLQTGWDMLRDTGLPFSHVAAEVGYAQTAAFSSAFRKRFGMTPSQVRNGQL